MQVASLRFLRFIGHQDWIRFGVRSRLIRAFCDPDNIDRAVEIYSLNHRYVGNLKNFVDWLAFFFGAQEKQELLFLAGLLRGVPQPVVLDIGANHGQHAAFLAKHAEIVHAFEPFEPVRGKMLERLELNSIHNVVVHPLGVGADDEDLPFYAPESTNSGTASFVQAHAANVNRPIGKLQVVNGDRYLAEIGLNAVHLIKIDVEGFEKSVLEGLRATLDQFRPLIFMEFSLETQQSFGDRETLMDRLPSGYEVFRALSDQPLLGVFNRARCQLVPFHFERSGGNLLLRPKETGDRTSSSVV